MDTFEIVVHNVRLDCRTAAEKSCNFPQLLLNAQKITTKKPYCIFCHKALYDVLCTFVAAQPVVKF